MEKFENMDEDPVAATVANIQESLANERKMSNPECFGWGNIFKPTPVVRHTLLIGLRVAVMQQASGIETAMVCVCACVCMGLREGVCLC